MHVLVVGGGIIGISTAWELLRRGHSVEVFESSEEVAQQTSFANGGMLTAGMCEPWNAPGVWKELLLSFFNPGSPMKLRVDAVPGLVLWGLRFLAESRKRCFSRNTFASYRLSSYSISLTDRWVSELGLDCDYRADAQTESGPSTGDLKIFTTQQSAEFAEGLASSLAPLGLRYESLDRSAVLEKEPALFDIRDEIDCGLYFPDDRAGDACQFTRQLAQRVTDAGGLIHRQWSVQSLTARSGVVSGVLAQGRDHGADAVVIAAANDSPGLVRPLGVRLPIKPVKGYSLTFDTHDIRHAVIPKIAVIHQAMHAGVNPLGTRLRVAGTAEFVKSRAPELSRERVDNLFYLLNRTYPSIAAELDTSRARVWCGFRPMSADGKPFIGGCNLRGLYINSGHGYLGWTQAVGSATLLADLIETRKPEIDPSPFAVAR